MKSNGCLLSRNRLLTVVLLVVTLTTGLKAAGEQSAAEERNSKYSRYEWKYRAFRMIGNSWQISAVAAGRLTRTIRKEENRYSFTIDEIKPKRVVTAKRQPGFELKCAKNMEVVSKDGQWQAEIPESSSKRHSLGIVDVTKDMLQYFKIKGQLKKPSTFKSFKNISGEAWRKDGRKARISKESVAAESPVAYNWRQKRYGEEAGVWYTVEQYESKARILRVKRTSGRMKHDPPSYSEFMEFLDTVKHAFRKKNLTGGDIWQFSDRIEIVVTTLEKVE